MNKVTWKVTPECDPDVPCALKGGLPGLLALWLCHSETAQSSLSLGWMVTGALMTSRPCHGDSSEPDHFVQGGAPDLGSCKSCLSVCLFVQSFLLPLLVFPSADLFLAAFMPLTHSS